MSITTQFLNSDFYRVSNELVLEILQFQNRQQIDKLRWVSKRFNKVITSKVYKFFFLIFNILLAHSYVLPLRVIYSLGVIFPDKHSEMEEGSLAYLSCEYQVNGFLRRLRFSQSTDNSYFLFSSTINSITLPKEDSLVHLLNSLVEATGQRLHVKSLAFTNELVYMPINIKEYLDFLCKKVFIANMLLINLDTKNFFDYFESKLPGWAVNLAFNGKYLIRFDFIFNTFRPILRCKGTIRRRRIQFL